MKRVHRLSRATPYRRSWRAAWEARNRVDEERRAQLDAIARDAEALCEALRRDANALISTSTLAAIRERTREAEASEIAARLRMLG